MYTTQCLKCGKVLKAKTNESLMGMLDVHLTTRKKECKSLKK